MIHKINQDKTHLNFVIPNHEYKLSHNFTPLLGRLHQASLAVGPRRAVCSRRENGFDTLVSGLQCI